MKRGDLVSLEPEQFIDYKTGEPNGFSKRGYAGIKPGEIGIILERVDREKWHVLFGEKISEIWGLDLRVLGMD
jgi:hypothetical protein